MTKCLKCVNYAKCIINSEAFLHNCFPNMYTLEKSNIFKKISIECLTITEIIWVLKYNQSLENCLLAWNYAKDRLTADHLLDVEIWGTHPEIISLIKNN